MPSPGLALLPFCASFPRRVPCRAVAHGCSALVSFRRNLSLVKELGDRAAQGRAYGNLGNTQYLLGNFSEAIAFHKEVGDTSAPFLGLGAAFLLTTAQQAQGDVSPSCFPPSCVNPRACPVVPTHTEQILLQSPSAPHEQLEGRVLLAWKPKETSKGRLQLGLARVFFFFALNLSQSRF